MNSFEAAEALALPTGYLGGRWMASRATYVYGGELGFAGRSFYYLGRGAALGDVLPEVVTSAMIFFPPYVVEPLWLEGRAVMEPASGLAAFSGCCWKWGRDRLAGASDLPRTTQLLAKAVDTGGRRFAGALRGLARGSAAGRSTLARCPSDACSTRVPRRLPWACGAGQRADSGRGRCRRDAGRRRGGTGIGRLGRTAPRAHRRSGGSPAEAEALTNRLVARGFSGLDDGERAELVERVNSLQAAVVASSASSKSAPAIQHHTS